MSASHPHPAAAEAHRPGHEHHGHNHAGHGHHHAPANFDRAFAIGISLNIAFVAIEAYFGWKVNSLALLADAGHKLGDVAGLVLDPGASLVIALVIVVGTRRLFRPSLHLVLPHGYPDHAFFESATRLPRERFRIGHVTLQVLRPPFMALCEGETAHP